MAVYAQDQSSILQALLGGGQKPNTPLPTLTPESLKRMRDQADSMEQAGMDYSPIASPWQGLARVAQGALGGWKEGAANRAEQAATAANNEPLSYWTGGGQSQASAPASSAPTQVSTNATHNGPQKDSAFGTVAPKLMGALQSDYGLSPAQAAGVVGSLGHESGGFNTMQEINPQGGGRGGLGYAQWTGPRRKAFEALLGGRDPSDFGANYDMLKSELGAKGEGPEGRVLAALKNAQTPEEAQRIWTSTFERPGVVADGSRNQWAQRAMALAGQGAPQPAMAQGAPQGVQVASADPNFMPQMPQGGGPVQPPEGGNLRAPIPGPQGAPQAPMQPPQGMQPPAPMQTAQAAPQGAPQGMGGPQGMGAQGGQPFNPMQIIQSDPRAQRAMQMMNSPFATPANKQMAEMYLKQVTQDPAIAQARQLEMEKDRLDMRKTEGEIGLQPGQLRAQEDTHSQVGKTGDMNEYNLVVEQAKANGVQPPSYFDYQQALRKSGASNVNIDQRGEDAFQKNMAEKQASMYSTMIDEGVQAKADLGQIQALRGNLANTPGGFLGGAMGMANSLGIKLGDNASSIEAANAIINKLVPTARPAGSGSSSDRDMAMFRAALPQLSNTPEGNEMILNTMQGMAQYKQSLGDIANNVAMGDMTRKDGLKAIQALPDPFAQFKTIAGKQGASGAPAGPAQPPGRAAPAAPTGLQIKPSGAIMDYMKSVAPEGRAAAIQKLRDNGIDVSGF